MARVFTRHFLRHRRSFPYPLPPHFLACSPSSFTSASPSSLHPPTLEPVNRILQTLQQCRNLFHLTQIHALLITSGHAQKPFFAAKLLNHSAEMGDLNYTLMIFRNVDFLNRICVNAVIKAYSASSAPLQGVVFYFQMLGAGFYVTSFTLPPLLSCCARSGCAVSGQKCHGQAIKRGFDGVLEIRNSLIHMYGCFGLVDVAACLFQEMMDRDLVSWHSMIGSLFRVGDVDSAHNLFDEMPEKNVVSWNVMLNGYLENRMPGFVLKLFRQMAEARFVGNARSIVSALTACGRSARLKEGMSVHGFLFRRNWNMNLILNTATIDMYNKCRKVTTARRIFDGLSEKNLACWNSMILGYCFHGDPRFGLDLFAEMVEKKGKKGGVIPDAITFTGVLCACTRAGLLEEGREYFRRMVGQFSIRPNFAHYWCMANLLASNGLIEEALETVKRANEFDGDLSPESVTWATLLALSRFEGRVLPGERVASALMLLEPENIMCYALLFNVYAAAGRWDEAFVLKEKIRERFTGKTAGSSLVDLIEIVHKLRLGDQNKVAVERVLSMDELFQGQNLCGVLSPHLRSQRHGVIKLGSEGQ